MLPLLRLPVHATNKLGGMELIRCFDPMQEALSPSVIGLGFFDGVHQGHRAIIGACVSAAKQQNLLACLHTYDIPPITLVKPTETVVELTPIQQKVALLASLGIQALAISHFDDAMMHLSGADFFESILLNRLHARHIVAGYDHRFGYRGDTDATGLRKLCEAHGIGLTVVPAVKTAGGEVVSSSAIRRALLSGNMALAEEMLGRYPDEALLERVKSSNSSVSS